MDESDGCIWASARRQEVHLRVGDRIRALRIACGISQRELARAVGLNSNASISNIELGKQRPPLHVYYMMAELLGVDVYDLIPRSVEDRLDG